MNLFPQCGALVCGREEYLLAVKEPCFGANSQRAVCERIGTLLL